MNKQFEEWLIKQEEIGYASYQFEDFPFSMQWGVYLEFFDSKVLPIDLSYVPQSRDWYLRIFTHTFSLGDTTREKAQQEAIKKAFEILEL